MTNTSSYTATVWEKTWSLYIDLLCEKDAKPGCPTVAKRLEMVVKRMRQMAPELMIRLEGK